MSNLINLVLFQLLWTFVKSDFPFDFQEIEQFSRDEKGSEEYRLPDVLDPLHYEVEITPYFQEAPSNKIPFTFDGRINFHFKAAADNISTLTIHENVRDILKIDLIKDSDRQPVELNPKNEFERLKEFNFLKINLLDGVTLNKGDVYNLKIEYIGNINETPLSRGVFRGNYKDNNGKLHWYLGTHLQPVNSRQAFPCLDEPGFKATFDIIINRPVNFAETFSNMKLKNSTVVGDRVKEIFFTTPRMSAYLVTFHVSEGFKAIADNKDEKNPFRIIARPNAEGQGDYSLQVGPAITQWLSDYFNISYYDMEEGIKNDHLASPDWASGATENWGLVSYRELRLLNEEGETNAADKMSIGTIIAHELAHKWFGNLITCRWWDNVWINEGFATYFETFAMDAVDTDLELADQFIITTVHSAMSSDSSENTRALQHKVNSPSEVTGHFSGISYTKGATLLLMLNNLVGEETFKRALYLFLNDRSFEHALPEDLYRFFAQAVSENKEVDVDIESFMKSWVDEPGYPLLNVNVNMNTGVIELKQERFFISPSANQTEQIWPIPITYTSGGSPNWDDLKPINIMKEQSFEIKKDPGHEWVIFNVQQKGMYRVNYDTHNWEMLASALRNNHTSIHHLNRAQIVDDVFALMRAEKMTYQLGLHVLEFLKKDISYYSWYSAISEFNWLRSRFLHLPDVLSQFDNLLKEYLETVIKAVGYDIQPKESPVTTLNRINILAFACNIGHEECKADALEKFKAFRDNGKSVDPNLRRHVFCTGIREGDVKDWDKLYERRVKSNNQADQMVMLRALGCTKDEDAVKKHLEMILNDDVVKAQDRVLAFSVLYSGHRDNAKLVLDFVKKNTKAIRTATVLQSSFDSILSTLASNLDEDGLDDMEQWLRVNQDLIPEYATGMSAITAAKNSMRWGTEKADSILQAVRGACSNIVPSITLLLTVLLVFMIR